MRKLKHEDNARPEGGYKSHDLYELKSLDLYQLL